MSDTPHKLRTAIFISGRGSNMKAIVEAARSPDFPASIDLIVSNNPDAEGLKFAKLNNIPTYVVPHGNYETREDFETALLGVLAPYEIELICLAGFMRLLTPLFISAYAGRIINIHPSLLPLYKGTNTHQRALDAGEAYTGCSVHYVIPEMDAGDVILQEKVVIEDNDTADTLATKTLAVEHKLYPAAIRIVADHLSQYTHEETSNAETTAQLKKHPFEKSHGGSHMANAPETKSHGNIKDTEIINSWMMWVRFTTVMKYSVIIIAAILILMALVWL